MWKTFVSEVKADFMDYHGWTAKDYFTDMCQKPSNADRIFSKPTNSTVRRGLRVSDIQVVSGSGMYCLTTPAVTERRLSQHDVSLRATLSVPRATRAFSESPVCAPSESQWESSSSSSSSCSSSNASLSYSGWLCWLHSLVLSSMLVDTHFVRRWCKQSAKNHLCKYTWVQMLWTFWPGAVTLPLHVKITLRSWKPNKRLNEFIAKAQWKFDMCRFGHLPFHHFWSSETSG